MKPIIILESVSDNGKVSISKEEFREIINKAYEAGVQDGSIHGCTYPIPNKYNPPYNFRGIEPPYKVSDAPLNKDTEITC